MSNESRTSEPAPARPRRALVVADAEAVAAVRERLAPAGYEVHGVGLDGAARAVTEFAPDVALVVFEGGGLHAEGAALVRRWRAEAPTYALPVAALFREDEAGPRASALRAGADDYFALTTPRAEMCARLDALFWRAEAGRRNVTVAGDRPAEIENFMLLLDAIGDDLRRGAVGTIALVGAAGGAKADGKIAGGNEKGFDGGGGSLGGDGVGARPPVIAEAYGFLRLNLRRLDAVAFYGPTLLLVYLPGVEGGAARVLLERLRVEFAGAGGFAVGLASFPSDGGEVEALVERAEASLVAALARDAAPRRSSAGGVGAPKPAASRGAGGAARTRRLLLTVSDAARMSRLNLLIRSAGYDVRAAFDGQQALNLLRIERPDLLLVDYELHDMDGVEMLRRLRRQSGGRLTLPVVLLLPARHEPARAEAVEAGARSIITLPYDPAELLDSVQSAAGNT